MQVWTNCNQPRATTVWCWRTCFGITGPQCMTANTVAVIFPCTTPPTRTRKRQALPTTTRKSQPAQLPNFTKVVHACNISLGTWQLVIATVKSCQRSFFCRYHTKNLVLRLMRLRKYSLCIDSMSFSSSRCSITLGFFFNFQSSV